MNPRQTPPTFKLLTILFIIVILAGSLLSIDLNVSNAQGQIQVTASDPALTEQGTINLNVKVTGKGFKNGAKAKWQVTGTTDTGGVTVNSTTFVSSSEVTANITVDDAAAIATFDIMVTNSDGRGGKGTELFRVTAKQAKAVQCPPIQPAPIGDSRCYAGLPGCLDSTFGGLGFVNTHVGDVTRGAAANDVAVQPDGKIVVVGSAFANTTNPSDFAVVRYNTDGSLDTSFGDIDPFNSVLRRGYAITPITTGADSIYGVVLQPDGKIVAVGLANSVDKVGVARYNSNGTLDNTFGSGGKALLNFGKATAVPYRDIALQSDGKIIIAGPAKAGQSVNGGFSVARLLTNGSLDSGFGSGGSVSVNPSGTNGSTVGWSLAIQRVPAITGEERIVMGGPAAEGWTLTRFKPNGVLDTSFGSAGVVKTPFLGFGDAVHRVSIDSNNRIVAAGNTRMANSNCGSYIMDFAVVRYTEDGNLDGSFGGGKQTVDVYGGMDQLYGLTVQADNKVILMGYANSSDLTVTNIAVVRINDDGSRDSSFGLAGNGMVTLDVHGFDDYGIATGLDPNDGKIIVVGSTVFSAGGVWDFLAARYLP